MAWLSVANSNKELCDKMIEHEVLMENSDIHHAHLATDRGDFVFPNTRREAYHDRPYKREYIHLSAPHMYITVLEALELREGLSFLNIGSGSGYLMCLVTYLLGPYGYCHGVELSEQTASHSRRCIAQWIEKIQIGREMDREQYPDLAEDNIEVICGDGFEIDIQYSRYNLYDRIYIGAGCPDARLPFFFDLLADGGILIVPNSDSNELTKVYKVRKGVITTSIISKVSFVPLIESPPGTNPPVKLPTLSWAPIAKVHMKFPPLFRTIVHTILFGRIYGKCNLPSQVWHLIFKFVPRDWFNPEFSHMQELEMELQAERELRLDLEKKLKKYKIISRQVERERDLYRVIINTHRRANTPQAPVVVDSSDEDEAQLNHGNGHRSHIVRAEGDRRRQRLNTDYFATPLEQGYDTSISVSDGDQDGDNSSEHDGTRDSGSDGHRSDAHVHANAPPLSNADHDTSEDHSAMQTEEEEY